MPHRARGYRLHDAHEHLSSTGRWHPGAGHLHLHHATLDRVSTAACDTASIEPQIFSAPPILHPRWAQTQQCTLSGTSRAPRLPASAAGPPPTPEKLTFIGHALTQPGLELLSSCPTQLPHKSPANITGASPCPCRGRHPCPGPSHPRPGLRAPAGGTSRRPQLPPLLALPPRPRPASDVWASL